MRVRFFLVVVSMLWPVPARAGDVVVLRAGARFPVSVVRQVGTRWRVVYQGGGVGDTLDDACARGELEVMPDVRVHA